MSELTLDTCLERNPDLVSADMDGELVMMSVEEGAYFGIGGVGARIWELLGSPTSLGEVVRHICGEYEVDRGTCERDVLAFAGELVGHGAAHRR